MATTFKTLTAFALAVGTSDRMTDAECAHWHGVYVKAAEAKQTKMRHEYCIAYMQGREKWTEAYAIEVSEMPRTRGSDEYAAWNRAQSNFHTRIVKGKDAVEQEAGAKKVRFSPEQMAGWEALDAMYETFADMDKAYKAYKARKAAK